MVKVSPEIKKLADKYCDEQGGPPSPVIEVDYAGVEARILTWTDEYSEITDQEWSKLMRFQYVYGMLGKKTQPEYKMILPIPKLPPEKPWTKFNPTPKNPKRGSK